MRILFADLDGFQSPYGDYLVRNLWVQLVKIIFAGFSPLTGITQLETLCTNDLLNPNKGFQSPYGDYLVRNCKLY